MKRLKTLSALEIVKGQHIELSNSDTFRTKVVLLTNHYGRIVELEASQYVTLLERFCSQHKDCDGYTNQCVPF